MDTPDADLVKTTIRIPRSLHKWLRIWAVQHDANLGDLIETVLREWAEAHGREGDDAGELLAKTPRPNPSS